MTDLTRNKPRRYRDEEKCKVGSMAAPTSAATTLFIGAAVQENAGQLENATGAGTLFAGFMKEQVTGNGAIDDKNRARVYTKGEVLLLVDATGAGTIARTDVGATVYLTDGDTFTLDSTTAQAIGKVSEVPEGAHGAAAAELWVSFEGVQERSL